MRSSPLFYGRTIKRRKGLKLLMSGRFGHSQSYVNEVARHAGLEVVEWKEEVLRQQGGQDVRGAVVTIRKREL